MCNNASRNYARRCGRSPSSLTTSRSPSALRSFPQSTGKTQWRPFCDPSPFAADHEQSPGKAHRCPARSRKGSSGHGGGHGGKFWHIYDGDRRAGSVWINQTHDRYLGEHASLTIELNEVSRGKGIGRRAYHLAAEASEHDEIWLHMRRSNIASRKAAEHAGYTVVAVPDRRQLVMRWQRSDS